MHYKFELEKRIEKEKVKIVDLKSQLDKAEAFVQGLQEALRLIPKDVDIARSPTSLLRAGSEMAKTRNFLKDAGKPMYINDILIGIGKEVTKANRENIGGSLGNYARREEIFTRTAPNTFGLVEFGDTLDETLSEEENSESNAPTNKGLFVMVTDEEDVTEMLPEDTQKEDDVPW